MTLQSGMIRLGDLDVHQVHGGRGRPVLFIHGLGSSGYMEWRFNLEPTATRHRVYAPDLPGYGRTGKPKVRYTIGYFARLIERYMENRGLLPKTPRQVWTSALRSANAARPACTTPRDP